MKNLLTIILSMGALLLVSCQSDADDIVGGFDADGFIESIEPGVNPGLAYFEAAMKPELWILQDTHEKKLAALNFPKSLSKKLTTDQLAECCVLYPLNFVYISHNENDEGILFVIAGFNGYNRLKERSDYAVSLINEYEKITEAAANAKDNYMLYLRHNFTRQFVENLLLSDYYPEVFKGENGARLRAIVESHEKTEPQPFTKLGGSEDLLRKIEQAASAN